MVVKDWSDRAEGVAAVQHDPEVLQQAPAEFWQNLEVVMAVMQQKHFLGHPLKYAPDSVPT